ncbi:hypothetical protein NX722_20550 [Endozoicomonas gorgoniicola]|uniref:Uncharacterized protein n=1 Tax=Endozoicomonas gorgoniicola TaxID=1234144 RepID=A0ABT3N027_9GAMM|nr:hypothetical protein [Endozoicomonas gorgoniicola]MCW7554966.1 hypothetical protein [Endozoicomonas gorgoniicola]
MSKAGFTTYVFKSRADAASFAAQVSNAQNKAQGKKAGFLSVGWAKLKSGITRQVKIPSSNTVAELTAMKPVVSSLQELEEKKLCTRKASVFDVPEDFKWSRGDAKSMSRHIVVRHWTTPGKKDSSIHTALSMKDKIAGVNEYATWAPGDIRLINWNQSKNLFKRLLAPIRMKLYRYLAQDFPETPKSYRKEKGMYLRPDTKFKLQDGVDARKLIANDEAEPSQTLLSQSDSHQDAVPKITDRTIKEANYNPLPFQKTSSKNGAEWQRRAEKHYLPCVGFDKHQESGKETFIMFGLDLDKMRERWEAVQDPDHPEHFYKTLSKTQNCSGMCLSLLKAGGSELFNTFSPSLVTTQGDMEKYSAKLLETLDNLNTSADALDKEVERYNVSSKPKLSLSHICEKLGSLPVKYTMDGRWKAKIQEVVSQIKNMDKPPQTIDGLTPIAIQLTKSLGELLYMTEDHPEFQDRLEPALHAFKILKNRMEDAYKEQIEMFEDPYYT